MKANKKETKLNRKQKYLKLTNIQGLAHGQEKQMNPQ